MTDSDTHPHAQSERLARPLWLACLALSVLLGGRLRFSHADWDGGMQLHPDERGILFVTETITLPGNLAEAFRVTSPLNPLRDEEGAPSAFAYGHLPLYLNAATAYLLNLPCDAPNNLCASIPPESFAGRLLNTGGAGRFEHLTYTGRALAALASTLTLIITALLARRLFGPWAGALAAALGAVAVLDVQEAHFGTVDTWLMFFAALTLWLLARYVDTEHPRDSLLAGVCIGLAVGSKVTGALLFLPLLAAHLRYSRQRPRISLPHESTLELTLLIALFAFIVTNPYALLDRTEYLQGIITQTRMASGAFDWSFVQQYRGTLPLIYPIEQQARWALGLPLTLAAYIGLLWSTIHAVKHPRPALIITLVWVWAMLLFIGTQLVKFPRYMLPTYPMLIALAAGLLTAPKRPAWRAALAALVWLPTLLFVLAFANMYRQPHPYVAASHWLYDTLPPDTGIVGEAGDDVLPLNLMHDGSMHIRDNVYDAELIFPFIPHGEANLDQMLGTLAGADTVVLASRRAYATIPRYPDRYPQTAAVYRALFAGELGYTVEATFSRSPALFGTSLVDDPFTRAGLPPPAGAIPAPSISLGFLDESLTIYDHPLVLVFRNEGHLSAEDMRNAVMQQMR